MAILATALAAPLAVAGPLALTPFALNDGFGPVAGAWRGSVNIIGAAFGDTVNAEVDWAAFYPGQFQQYLNSQGIAQVAPGGPNEVAYVYQISSVTSATPGIDSLTVGVDAADVRGSVLPPAFVLTGAGTEKSPTGGGDNNTSMAWYFSGSSFLPGNTSSLLVFTSPYLPEFDFLQVNSGLAGAPVSPLVASIGTRPIPEPSSLAAIGFAVLMLFGRSKRSR
jgi:hypothetical protein